MVTSCFIIFKKNPGAILYLFFAIFLISVCISCQGANKDSDFTKDSVDLNTEEWIDLNKWILEDTIFSISSGELDSFSMDLNGDTRDELFLCFPAACGTAGNCFWHVFQRIDTMVKEIGFIEGSIEIKEVKTNGHRDILASWHLSAQNRTLSIYRFVNGIYQRAEYFDCRIDINGKETCVPLPLPKQD